MTNSPNSRSNQERHNIFETLANRRNTVIGTAIHMETQAELSAFGPVAIQEQESARIYTLPARPEVAPVEQTRMASITHLPLQNEVATPVGPVNVERPPEIGEQERMRLEAQRKVADALGEAA